MSVITETETRDHLLGGVADDGAVGPRPRERLRLVVVGGGMAGFGLCKRLVNAGANETYDVAIFGDEPTPAYDRVNLSKTFAGESANSLQLADRRWYQRHDIDLHTGRRIERIDRRRQEVVDHQGHRHRYDRLVLATGSQARVLTVPGSDSPGVFVYRTLQDLENIQQYVSKRRARIGAVIGGGLLGLEAAKVLHDLGLQTSVLEMAPGLMPRQLDAQAATILKERIESMGVAVHLVRRTKSIVPQNDGPLEIHFANADPLLTDILIVAAGVIPNDGLARRGGLEVAQRGGIVVDDCLQTTDPKIFAIGECISHRDHVYGLVAPCYRMADTLANRLTGRDDRFHGADESAELKLMGVQVVALGQAIGDSPAGTTITQRDEHGYRKLVLSRGNIVGAACVGSWDQLAQIRQAVHHRQRLWPWQRSRFVRTGLPWVGAGALSVADWPNNSIVCSCHSVSKSTLAALIDQGVVDVDQLAEVSGASTACGSCRPLVCQLAGRTSQPANAAASTTMMVASTIAVLLTAMVLLSPPIPLADSVQSWWRQVDILWRSDVARQITGFTLLGILLVGLTFSARKRVARFCWGSYGSWRAMHGILGVAGLIAVAVHTGMRMGSNLNLLLAIVFLATSFLGAIAGIFSSLEGRIQGYQAIWIRRWRPRLTRLHLWLFWPLPLLIAFHVFSFYWFRD